MRIYLYLIAGLTSALMGWNIGQFFISDLKILTVFPFPEMILFPCVAVSLAMGMILNEILISNPTRISLCLRKVTKPLLIALGLGIGIGLVSGGLSAILLQPSLSIPPLLIRVLAWLLIGLAVGLAEGLSWRWQTIEAGDPQRFWKRLIISILGASLASLLAATLFETFRHSISGTILKNAEDPIGFSLLGILLGLTFSLTNSPSYLIALRAGAGFEYTTDTEEDYDYDDQEEETDQTEEEIRDTLPKILYPRINNPVLKFVSRSQGRRIEEGLSIQLPNNRKIAKLTIGSEVNADIYIPHLPPQIATLKLESRQTLLVPTKKHFKQIFINGRRIPNSDPVALKHNNLIAFTTQEDPESIHEKKTYRFIYYNRFLDPQA